jgi:hypothetical protein
MREKNLSILFLAILGLFSQVLYSQDYGPKIGPYSKKNRFRHNDASTKLLAGHRHVPIHDGIKAYSKDGEAVALKQTDTVEVEFVYDGSWSGKNGKWVLFHTYGMISGTTSTQAYYAFLGDLKDVEAESKIADSLTDAGKQKSLTRFRNIFFKNVLPVVLLLFSTIYFLRRFYLKISDLFTKLSGHVISGCLGLLLLSPVAIALFDVLSSGRSEEGNIMMNFVYKNFNINPSLHNTANFGEINFWDAFYFEAMMTLITIAVIFFVWIGMGFVLSGIVTLLTSGSPATAYGTSYDGGKTINIHSITPGSPGPDVDLSAVVKFWLVYSIVFPLMYFITEVVWGNENLFQLIFVALVLTAVVTAIYKFLAVKRERFKNFSSKFALSFLGFAVTIIALFIIFILIKLLFNKLSQ